MIENKAGCNPVYSGMRRILCALLPLTVIAILPQISEAHGAVSKPLLLSQADRTIASQISHVAASNPLAAVGAARTQPQVRSALLGPDHRTIELYFRDGATATLLPAMGGTSARSLPLRTLVMARQTDSQSGPARAVVLEPFAKELGDGDSAGQSEIDMLTRAGFKVDVFRNQQVTIKLLLTLSQYSVVYMKTHAGVLPNGGDAVIAAGDTATAPYIAMFGKTAYYNDQHPNAPTVLGQVFVDGGDGGLFNAIRAKFVTDYLTPFPNSSIFFLNGCDILLAPAFLKALQSKNLSSVVTWDQEVRADAADRGLDYTLNQMTSGDPLSLAITSAIFNGVGTAFTANGPAHLRYVGSGDITLKDAVNQATPTPSPTANPMFTVTPTATLTSTPTPGATVVPSVSPTAAPLFVRVKLAHARLKVGQSQKVAVTTVGGTFVKIVLQFPNNKKKTHTGHANPSGTLSWTFTQPSLKLTGKSRIVKVTTTVGRTGHTKRSVKAYTLA